LSVNQLSLSTLTLLHQTTELGKDAEEKVFAPLQSTCTADPTYSPQDCQRLDWSVLKWNQPSIDFYEKALGAFPMSEWQQVNNTLRS